MSTVDRPGARVLPPLVAGQRLDQPTFHQRYEAMPPGIRAELVGGVVHMPSPVGYQHGDLDHLVSFWVMSYRKSTPGLASSSNATTRLGVGGEIQPDSQLRIPERRGGRTRLVAGYVAGPPELVIEIGKSSRAFDLGVKKEECEKAGVLEYLFLGIEPDEVRWFALQAGSFREIGPGPDGIHRSGVFPGLWLDPAALFSGDLHGLIAALDRGLATPEHAAFVARLAGGSNP